MIKQALCIAVLWVPSAQALEALRLFHTPAERHVFAERAVDRGGRARPEPAPSGWIASESGRTRWQGADPRPTVSVQVHPWD